MTDMKCRVCGRIINKRINRKGWYHINVKMDHWASPDYLRYIKENFQNPPKIGDYIYLITAIIGAITAIIILFREWR